VKRCRRDCRKKSSPSRNPAKKGSSRNSSSVKGKRDIADRAPSSATREKREVGGVGVGGSRRAILRGEGSSRSYEVRKSCSGEGNPGRRLGFRRGRRGDCSKGGRWRWKKKASMRKERVSRKKKPCRLPWRIGRLGDQYSRGRGAKKEGKVFVFVDYGRFPNL